MKEIKQYWRYYGVISLVAVLAHGLILLNDGIYWDGWRNYTFAVEKRWDLLYDDYFLQAGRPMYAVIFWVFGYFPSPILAHRLLTVAMLICIGAILYTISLTTGRLTRHECLLLALTTVCFPAFQLAFEFTFFPYIASYFFFLLATAIGLHMSKSQQKKRLLLRVVALLFFVISFTLDSFLLFYFLFIGLLANQRRKELVNFRSLLRISLSYLDFLILPVVYWLIHETLFPRYGIYGYLNQFKLDFGSIIRQIHAFLLWGIIIPFERVGILSVLIVSAIAATRRNWVVRLNFGRREETKALILFALVALALAITPYVIVGKAPTGDVWESRHMLLIGIPVGLLLIGLLRATFSFYSRSSVVAGVIVILLLFSFIAQLWSNYLYWQVRWIKDQAIMAEIAQLEDIESVAVFLVEDRTGIGLGERYLAWELTAFFREALGTESHVAVSDLRDLELMTNSPYSSLWFSATYFMDDVDPSGCRAKLIVDVTDKYRYSELVAFYFLIKYGYDRPDSLNSFLRDIIVLRQVPLNC